METVESAGHLSLGGGEVVGPFRLPCDIYQNPRTHEFDDGFGDESFPVTIPRLVGLLQGGAIPISGAIG
jgi:hypothetical protein